MASILSELNNLHYDVLFFSNADPNGRGSSKEWVEKLVIVGFPKAASSVHITGMVIL
jgi:hypothetical protein